MKRNAKRVLATVVSLALVLSCMAFQPAKTVKAANESSDDKSNHWEVYGGKSFWYENGVKQGTFSDEKGVMGDGTIRGREICDPNVLDLNGNGTWFWLDSVYDGAKACNKEVWMPYIYQNEKDLDDDAIEAYAADSKAMAAQVAETMKKGRDGKSGNGKWVRYDAEGGMIKGWYKVQGADEALYPEQKGNIYYYDPKTGLMAKGRLTLDGKDYVFDDSTGKLLEGEAPADIDNNSTTGGTDDSNSGNGTTGGTDDSNSGNGTADDTGEADKGEPKETKTLLEKEMHYNPDGSVDWTTYNYTYEYDDKGNLTKKAGYNSDGSSSWFYSTTYEYDGMGNQTKETHYYADGSINWDWSNASEYDSTGKLTKFTHYTADGSDVYVWNNVFEYDGKGNVAKKIEWVQVGFDEGGIPETYDEGLVSTTSYTYDSKGNLTQYTVVGYDSVEEYSYSYAYEYDSKGNKTKELYYWSEKNNDWTVVHTYEYDGRGNLTKEFSYNADGSVAWEGCQTDEYDSKGNLTKRLHYNADGSVSWLNSDTYEYDSRGNRTKSFSYNDDGNIASWRIYEYDSEGNKTKDTWYGANGSVGGWCIYEYKTIKIY